VEGTLLDIMALLPQWISVCLLTPPAMVRYLLVSSCTSVSPDAFLHVIEVRGRRTRGCLRACACALPPPYPRLRRGHAPAVRLTTD
jgi:hypothetical protein